MTAVLPAVLVSYAARRLEGGTRVQTPKSAADARVSQGQRRGCTPILKFSITNPAPRAQRAKVQSDDEAVAW